jgi:prophage tail gpP-like protein
MTVDATSTEIVEQRSLPDDDVTLEIDGLAWTGWTDVRITRGVERCPSDFEVRLTEFIPGQDAIKILRGATVKVKIGRDLVLTGYVDRVTRTYDARSHSVTIVGRSKCADLVDCSAEWPGGQIVGSSVLEIAQKLAAPYGITVASHDGNDGPAIPQFNLNRGETPFEIIERLCRAAQLLAYDMPDGSLMLSALQEEQAASGFREGINVQRATYSAMLDQRYSEYESYMQSVEMFKDAGIGSDLIAAVQDPTVPRHRRKIFIVEINGVSSLAIAGQRAAWEKNRRIGRSNVVQLITDSWRDSAGVLYRPNTQALVELPTLQVKSANLTIGEVTYHRNEAGTSCELTLMLSGAYEPEPYDLNKLNPIKELSGVAPKPGG